MDPLLIVLIIVAILAIGGWGYGAYAVRPAPGATTEVVTGPAWVTPIGLLGLIVIVGIVLMLITGWRPFVVVGP
jgi:hypothetical protein